jgi:hypothetical protein
MISSQSHDLNAKSDQGNDGLIALAKSLGLDDRSGGEACHTNGCVSLHGLSDEEFTHLKVRVCLRDDEEFRVQPGATALEPAIDADHGHVVHQGDLDSNERPAVKRRLLRTAAFVVITGVLVTATFAWQFHGDVQRSHMVDAGKLHRAIIGAKSSRSDVVPVEMAANPSAGGTCRSIRASVGRAGIVC